MGFSFQVSAIGSGILRSISTILYIVLALLVEWTGQVASAWCTVSIGFETWQFGQDGDGVVSGSLL